MKILLTGGTGFIGKQVALLLRQKSHDIKILGRSVDSNIQTDLTEISDKAKNTILEFKPDACIHLAWQGIPDYSFETCRLNFDASVNLFQILTKSGCKKIVSAGSCWEYG